jgi:pantetheine-phosphate adenylyltransferase
MDKTAVYPGTFDPVTNGHLDLMERGLKIFDKIVFAVAANTGKKPLFNLDERVHFIKTALIGHPMEKHVEVDSFSGLLVDYVERIQADAIIRGLRAVSDFEYEFQMALMNRRLNTEVETLFLMTGMRWIYISSTLIKEVVLSGGCVTGLVPDLVERNLIERLAQPVKTCLPS